MMSIAALLTTSCTPVTSPPEQLDYRDAVEGAAAMYIETLAGANAKLYNLGETSLPGTPQYAIKFSTAPEIEDGGDKNAVLIECGMHAREWFAAESCYWLVDHLVLNQNDAEIAALWENVDIWILPQTNPAGRQIDDLRWGDPTQYLHVCKGGGNEGDACSGDGECDSGDCYGTGWRTNANTSDCPVGVDLARNFSSGWNSAASACTVSDFMKYRGPNPFSELETLNLRRFIHNHMVSTVLIVHANAQQTWNRWASPSTANDAMVDELASLNSVGVGADSEAAMPRDSVGGGYGQFSAWLTQASNVAGELDLGTERNISTFFFELPISGSPNPYYSQDYDGDDYRFTPGDGSNSFHPSSSVWYRLFTASILPMMINVIRQAASPQCPVDASFARITANCEANDFGLVGMKIAPGISEGGALEFNAGTREESLSEGDYSVVFAVQNYSVAAENTNTNAEVRIYQDGVVVETQSQAISLSPGSRGTYAISHGFDGGHAYRVELELDSDDFTRDNVKSLAFRVESLMKVRPPEELRIVDLGIRPLKDSPRWLLEGRIEYRGKISEPLPDATVKLVVFPRRRAAVPKPLIWKAPARVQLRKAQEWIDLDSAEPSKGMASFDLLPKTSTSYHLRVVVDDPLVAHALAQQGTVAMRVTLGTRFSAQGVRSSKLPALIKVNPMNAEEDPEDEP